MATNLKFINFAAIGLLLFAIQPSFTKAYIDTSPSYPEPISELKDAIVKGMGFQADDFKISGFDLKDALVGKSVAYEFDVEIDNKVLPLKLLEDVNRWEYVDLPIFRMEDQAKAGDDKRLAEKEKLEEEMPVLAPFQLAGPMELWIQDAKDIRVSLPHDVDAGALKKVVLAEGAVVTVKGARSVSLRHPIQLPLPFNRTNSGFASGILNLAERLRHASRAQETPLLSLRIVGPTSLTSPSTSSASPSNKLKLKRLAPGFVELSSEPKIKSVGTNSEIDIQGEGTALLTPDHFTALWPLTSINGSNRNLLGFESLLSSLLGPRGTKEGSFKLLKAEVSAQTFVKIGFGVEKKLKKEDPILQGFPEWRTKPETVRIHFEVLAKVDGNKIVPERVVQINPTAIEDTMAENVHLGNVTMSKSSDVQPPPIPFTL